MTEKDLCKAIENYKNSAAEDMREKAIQTLGIYLYTGLQRYRLDYLDEDIRSDFIVWMYPRFGKIIDQFDNAKASFNTYISWVVRLSYRTFCRSRYGSEARQKVLEAEETTRLMSIEAENSNTGLWNSCTSETTENYGKMKTLSAKPPLSKKKKELHARRIFLLACKAGNFLDESAAAKIADYTGYDEEYVRSKLEYIRSKCSAKREQMQAIREKQNSCYIRAQKCLLEMKFLEKGSSRYESLDKEYRYCIKRLESLRARASRQIRAPSNRFLASALGISRGTIDSTLASAKQHEYSGES